MPEDLTRLPAQLVSEAFMETKITFLTDVQLWPGRQTLDPYAWLENFRPGERDYALSLLNSFLFFSEPLVDALLRSAVQGLSAAITATARSLADAKARWRSFLAELRVTYVEGELPRPTDSGILFARKARQVLDIDDTHIVPPRQALETLFQNPACPVLFVDDFVGGGSQMSATWHRLYQFSPQQGMSFQKLALQGNHLVYYTPLVATSHGLDILAHKCPGLRVFPAHTLDARYSLTSSDCVLWPPALKPRAVEVLFEASQRAGIVEGYRFGWQGFHNLALALAFWHSVPDATLPLIFWEQKGWAPLIRRT